MPKPNIDDVAMAFYAFHTAVVAAMRVGLADPKRVQLFEEARDTLQHRLRELNLAQHIDFTEKPDA